MSDGNAATRGISNTDRERIAEILRRPERMSPETCARVRQRVRNGETSTEIADDEDDIQWSESTIRHHAYGRCSHDSDEQPLRPPDGTQRSPITRAECARIRHQRAAGIQASAIADEMDCGESTVFAHANGHCSHEVEATDGGERR